MMDEKGVPCSSMELCEEQKESFDLMFFKVSCALYAIRLLTESKVFDANWSETRNGMLLGSAHLLGLLAGGVRTGGNGTNKAKLLHKLDIAQREISELKKLRSEDAKANEKVVSMYATHEQRWFSERKKLRQQIIALMNGLRVLETKRENSVSKLNEKLQEKEALLMSKEKSVVFEEQKRNDIENKLKNAENSIKNIQESANLETQRHSAEISKHKSAFIELVSNQRQLEAEMGRALRQVESAKEEIDSILEQKEQAFLMTQKLSFELVKVRRDSEQKDQILSAMLRKSKLDTAEKQMLLEEMKLSKAKKKQEEIKSEKFKKDSLRSILSKHSNSKRDTFSSAHPNASMPSNIDTARNHHMNFFFEFEQPELLHGQDQYTFDRYQKSTNFKQLDDRGQDEAYGSTIDLRHHLEVDAFTEQLRLKDEKLEAFHWRLLNMELESKKMKSLVEGLDRDLGHLKQENKKLETLLSNRETELLSLKEKLTQKAKKNTVEEAKEITEENQKDKDSNFTHKKDIVLLLQSPERESEEDDGDNTESPDYIQEDFTLSEKAEASSSSSVRKYITKTHTSPQKMDIHALGVSYKIQRLKQQLQMLEKLAGKQESPDNNGEYDMKSFFALLSLLKRQINRYLSLQGKTDDLCQRMHENDVHGKKGNPKAAKSKDETRILEHYLEETFQLQRYMVASGQKLMELQAKISKGFNEVANELDTPDTFDMKKYSDSIRTHFGDIQRGLEIRISRIIGDIEGTLARDGIIYFKK